MNRPTLGKIATDLLQKEPETRDPIAIEREMQKDYMNNLFAAVDRGYAKYEGDFYIVVETKWEKILERVFRNYFIDRLTCPTPNYDQSVFRYNRKLGQIEYLWTIPSQDASHHLRDNAMYVAKEEQGLLNFVLQFDQGILYRACKKFNNEKDDSTQLASSK